MRQQRLLSTVINGIPLQLRSYSSDLNVAIESLARDEYNFLALANPKVIFDLGANIGTSSIALAKLYPESIIYAVEMERENFSLLKNNVRTYKNIVPVNLAIAGASGSRVLIDRQTGPWGYTIIDSASGQVGVPVEASSIDDLMSKLKIQTIDLVKMDIEGAEKEIFNSGGNWLEVTDAIVVELHDRITMGCSRSFYLATSSFQCFERYGEKVLARRHPK